MTGSADSVKPLSDQFIYKICSCNVWKEIQSLQHWEGSRDDLRDGFIHFSSATQVQGTVSKHFPGQTDLVLISIDPAALGDHLRWELSRSGEPFPHLYSPLPLSAVVSAESLHVSGGNEQGIRYGQGTTEAQRQDAS